MNEQCDFFALVKSILKHREKSAERGLRLVYKVVIDNIVSNDNTPFGILVSVSAVDSDARIAVDFAPIQLKDVGHQFLETIREVNGYLVGPGGDAALITFRESDRVYCSLQCVAERIAIHEKPS